MMGTQVRDGPTLASGAQGAPCLVPLNQGLLTGFQLDFNRVVRNLVDPPP